MTNGEWIEEKLMKFMEWYAKRVWWFVPLFVAIVTTIFILSAKIHEDFVYLAIFLTILFGGCSGYVHRSKVCLRKKQKK